MFKSRNLTNQSQQKSLTERLKIKDVPFWVHGIGLGGTALIFLSYLLIFLIWKDSSVWKTWVAADELSKPEYGEQIFADSIFRTRANTWSNLVYICLGFYMIALACYDQKKAWTLSRGYLAATPVLSFLFGLSAIYLGLGSSFFHASLTRYGQQLDVGGMYATLLCLSAMAIGSWLPRLEFPIIRKEFPSWPIWSLAILFGSAYFTYYKWDYSFTEISGYFSGILILFALVSAFTPGKYLQTAWFVLGLVSIALGSQIRDLDIADRFSSPDSIFQGHAIWHFVSCLMYVFLIMYFRSEERRI